MGRSLSRLLKSLYGLYLNASLKSKFIVTNLLIVLIPILIVGTLFYLYTAGVIRDNAASYKFNIVQLMSERLDSYVAQLKLLTYSMYQSDVQRLLSAEVPGDPIDKVMYDEELFSYLIASANFTSAEASFDHAVFIRTDGQFHQIGSTAIKPDFPFPGTDWYKKSMSLGGQIEMFFPDDRPYLAIPQNEMVLSLTRQIKSMDSGRDLGVLLIDVPIRKIGSLFRSMPIQPDDIYVINETGRIIYSSNPQLIGRTLLPEYYEWIGKGESGTEIRTIGSERFLVTYHASAETDWMFISLDRMGDLILTLNDLRNRGIALGLLSLLVGILLATFFSTQVTRPISYLQGQMRRFQNGELISRIKWSRKDEIGKLAESFNEMTEHINRLIRQNYLAGIKQREAQFHALQAQINPHFLYNTLDSISNIAQAEQVPYISEISIRLAEMLRYSISKKGPVVTLREELNHIKAYLLIQNIRYDNKFTAVWNIEPGTLELSVIKLTLQPLVENAVYHGLEVKMGPGKIAISSRIEDDYLLIRIEDDGVGIPPGRLAEIQEELRSPVATKHDGGEPEGKRGLGIVNVHERIRLHFGDKYGLELTSGPEGTCVVVRLPAVRP